MRTVIAGLAIIAPASIASAQDWSQWRGPARDGVIPTAVIPKAWPAAVKRGWSVELGEGYSSPVVANGRAFVHSRRDPEEIVTAIDLATGKIGWQQKYSSEFKKNQYATQMAKGPNSTPLIVGSRLFTTPSRALVAHGNPSTCGEMPMSLCTRCRPSSPTA